MEAYSYWPPTALKSTRAIRVNDGPALAVIVSWMNAWSTSARCATAGGSSTRGAAGPARIHWRTLQWPSMAWSTLAGARAWAISAALTWPGSASPAAAASRRASGLAIARAPGWRAGVGDSVVGRGFVAGAAALGVAWLATGFSSAMVPSTAPTGASCPSAK